MREKQSPWWYGRSKTALAMGLLGLLSACGESDNNTPVAVDLSPRVSAYAAIGQLAMRAEGTPPDRLEDLKGSDADNNGIRDDIDAYIAKRDYTPKQKKAVEQYARSIQNGILSDKSNRDTVMEMAQESSRAVKCLSSLGSPQSSKFSGEIIRDYSKLTSNTPGRARADRALDLALSGRGWEFPRGDTCEN